MEFPSRKSIRLRHWDYSNAGCYHVTICTVGKAMLFGRVIQPEGSKPCVELTELGRVCEAAVFATVARFPTVDIANHVVMPNHMHMLISLRGADAPKLSRVVQFLKAEVTKEARRADPGAVVWQPRYHDHIIRGEADFQRTWEYIDENPAKWRNDAYYL